MTKRFAFFAATLLLSLAACAQERPRHLSDDSDWWSFVRTEAHPDPDLGGKIDWQKRKVADNNFQVVGLKPSVSVELEKLREVLGPTPSVSRGDAASGREQYCYVSRSHRLHLIVEVGEVEWVMYLFRNGASWTGEELCSPSALVTDAIGTASGLRLGVSPAAVKKVLGTPNVDKPGRLVYLFEYQQKTTTKDLERLRKENPQMSEEEFQRSYGEYQVDILVDARFASGKLDYLAVSRAGVY